MPLYEYRCSKCEHTFEKIQKFSDKNGRCPRCGGAGKRLLSAPAIQFKGSGWYVTDYGKGKRPRPEASENKETKSDGAAKSEPSAAAPDKKKAKKR